MRIKKPLLLVIAGVLLVSVAIYATKDSKELATSPLTLYGHIDARTQTLAIESAGRLEEVHCREGDRVSMGDILASVQSEPYRIGVDQAFGQWQSAKAQLTKAIAGPREETIQSAQAQTLATREAAQEAQRICARQNALGTATSQQQIDSACSKAKVLRAQSNASEMQLAQLLAGTRAEDIEVAKANEAMARATLEEAKRRLTECELKSPAQGIIRVRMKEPGEMVNAATPIYELALTDPVWVRAWVDEVNLGRIKTGDTVDVISDSFKTSFKARVGYISSVAEFTPKMVQTEALRTSLVYEVRITLEDKNGQLRMGMPVTVKWPELDQQK